MCVRLQEFNFHLRSTLPTEAMLLSSNHMHNSLLLRLSQPLFASSISNRSTFGDGNGQKQDGNFVAPKDHHPVS
jgi:hypothetical protein